MSPSQRSRFTAYLARRPGSLIRATIGAASSRAASWPSVVSRSCLASALLMANSNSGTRLATRSRTAPSPCLSRRSQGSRPSGCTATNVWVTNFSSRLNARSAARWPAASPSKVKITSPSLPLVSMISRRRTLTWSSPKLVPQVATAVGTPDRWQAITSVYPSTITACRRCAISRFARSAPYSTWPFLNSAVSGVFRYLGPSSSGSSLRAPNAIVSPVRSRTGHISRPRNMSIRPRLPCLARPALSSSSSVNPRPRRCLVSSSHAAGEYPTPNRSASDSSKPRSARNARAAEAESPRIRSE